MWSGQTGPDPAHVTDLTELATQFDLLRVRAARGSGRPKVSLAELTRRLGLPPTSKSTVHSYVTGKTLAPAEVLDRIVIALGASPAEQRAWAEAWYRISAAPRRKARYSPRGLPDPPEHLDSEFVGREWALDRIEAWWRGGEPVLVVTGEPGAGKSALVARLVSGGLVSAAHYCRQRVAESLDANTVIRSLAAQLWRNVPGIADALPRPEVLDAEIEPRQLFDKAIRQPLRSVRTAAVVVVDALDEAVEGGGGHGLVTVLARESRMPTPNLRLLVTSRPGRALRHFAVTSRFDLIEDEADAGGDVRAYAERRLRAHQVPAAEVLARRIASRGRGNFLYARFVLDDLLGRGQPVTTGAIRLPDGLAELYREFLDREIAAVEPDWRLRYRPVLGLLTQARGDGFTVDQLVTLTGLTRSAVEDALAVCAPYLRGHGPFQIFHQSFRDYLRAPGEHHVYPAEAAGTILAELRRAPLEPYAVQHFPRHVVDAAQLGVDARTVLERMLCDLDFLSAKAMADGGKLVAELGDAVAAAGPLTGRAARLWDLLIHQARNLRRWPSARQPSFLLQQLHYAATQAGSTDLRADLEEYASRHHVSHLRVNWTRTEAGEGHADTVITVAVSADNRFTATGSYDQTVRIWDEHGAILRVLDHPGPVQQVVMLPDHRVASTCEDHVVRLWACEPDGPDGELPHPDTVGPIAVTEAGRLIVGCVDGIARVWDVAEGAVRHELIHDSAVRCVAVAGEVVVTGSDDGSAYLWNLGNGRLLQHFEHREPVTSVLAHENRVVTVEGDRRIAVWDGTTGDPVRMFEAPARVRAVAVRDGLVAASGNRVWRWDLDRDTPPEVLARHDDIVDGFRLAGGDLLTFGRDNVARLSTVDRVHVLPHEDWVRGGTVAGRMVVTVSDDRTVRWWDRGIGSPVRVLTGNADSVRTIAVEPGGRWVVAGSDDGTVRVRDLRTGSLLHEFRHEGMVRAVAATADTVVSGSDDHTVRIWSVRAGQMVGTLRAGGPVRAVHAVAEGVIAASDDHLVRFWRGDCAVLSGHADLVRAIAVSNRFIVTGSRDATAIVWSRRTFHPVHVLRHPAWVRGIAVTPDERTVATSCIDGVVRIWSLRDGKLVRELTGHQNSVRDIRLTADGSRVVTASGDRTARVWDLHTYQEVHRLSHDSWVRSVQLTPDGRHAVTTSDDRTLRVWSLLTGSELHRVAASHRIACCAAAPGVIAFGTSRGELCCVALEEGRSACSTSETTAATHPGHDFARSVGNAVERWVRE